MEAKKLWEKGYTLNQKIADFIVGNDYILDKNLVKYDCIGSIAHVKMLSKVGLLSKSEADKLIQGLKKIIVLDKEGKFKIQKDQEDCHTAIENWLTENLSEVGKKVHTGRSRNDQVLTALRLYYKDKIKDCVLLSEKFISSIEGFVKKYGRVVLPGYTHTRKAMPSSISLWGNSFVDSMKDNIELLDGALELVDQSPLGGGAGYGVPLDIDKKYTAKELGFAKVQENPIYVQASRGKFESTILHALSQIMFDLNKIASDLIIFSMPEFGYFEIPENFCSGSSIMPQKRNPDFLERMRANYHIIVSYESRVKEISGNLISGYNGDIQLTKEPIMQGFDITTSSLSVASLLFEGLKVNRAKCSKALTEELYATERAYELVKKGMPFRDAYRKVSKKYKSR